MIEPGSEAVVAATAIVINSGALLSFWIWARNNIAETRAKVAAMEEAVKAIRSTCSERREWLEKMNRVGQVTARNVVRIAQAQNVHVENVD